MLRTASAVRTAAAIVTASAVTPSATGGVLHARTVIVLDARIPWLLFLRRLVFGGNGVATSRFCGSGIGSFVC